MNFGFLATIQIMLIFVGFYWMLKKNDELPLMTAMCMAYIASYRFWAVEIAEINTPADLGNFGLAPVTYERSLSALAYIVLGEFCFLAAYMMMRRVPLPRMPSRTDTRL